MTKRKFTTWGLVTTRGKIIWDSTWTTRSLAESWIAVLESEPGRVRGKIKGVVKLETRIVTGLP